METFKNTVSLGHYYWDVGVNNGKSQVSKVVCPADWRKLSRKKVEIESADGKRLFRVVTKQNVSSLRFYHVCSTFTTFYLGEAS
jgi:hypothetical protein